MDFSLQCNKVAKSKHRDRLSELPDSLLLVILSLLQMKDVVATTILSKRWKNLWTTVPCLDFWYHSYDLHEYRSFIYGALAQWRGPKILKFCIAFSYFYPRACDLDSWMLFAIEKQVPDLSILLGRLRDWDSEYYPPQRLYSCSWITKLSLSYCKLKIHEKVQWAQLKSLTIEASNSFTEDSMDNLLSGAPLLEELILFIRIITDNFNIRSTSLKRLRFGCDDRCFGTATVHSVLRIWTPNLLTLEFSGIIYGDCFLDVPSLTNADLYFLDYRKEKLANSSPYKMLHHVFQSVCHVENVTFSKWCIEFLLHMKNNDMVVHFPNAKFLKLYTGEEIHKMLAVLEMFPNLMSLIAELEYPQSGYSFVSKTIVSLLHLKTVKISWSLSCPSIFPLTEVLLENAHMLEKMVLRLTSHDVDPERFILALEKLLSMRRSSPYAKVIISKD